MRVKVTIQPIYNKSVLPLKTEWEKTIYVDIANSEVLRVVLESASRTCQLICDETKG